MIYFALHSWLASLHLKKWVANHWPGFMPAYRLAYNTLSIVLLLPLLWLMHQNPGPLLWEWHGLMAMVMNGLMLAAIGGFAWSLGSYDNKVFLGWTQWKNRHRAIEDPDRLFISSLHRFVRHPWYFFILVILWTQDIHFSQLVTYGLISVYLVIGSRLEERKLVKQFGEAYQQYMQKVPGLVPLPWLFLRKGEAEALIRLSGRKPDI